MTVEQWDRFVRMALDPNLYTDATFLEWWVPSFEADLNAIELGGWNNLSQDNRPQAWASWTAGAVARDLRKPVGRASLIREVQKQLREVIDLVNNKNDDSLRTALIDRLHSPEYIFRDVTREFAVKHYSEGLRKHSQQDAFHPSQVDKV